MNRTILDTSALIRFLTNDIPSKAQQVKDLIESEQKLQIPDVVFPELEYVLLGKTYHSNRSMIQKAFRYLITRKNIKVTPELKKAVDMYHTSKLDMADCIIVSYSNNNQLLSFDKKLLSLHQSQ